MKTSVNRTSQQPIDEFDLLEEYLHLMLTPVQPRSDFAERLQKNMTVVSAQLEAPNIDSPNIIRTVLLSAAGLISGVIIIVTGVRTVIRIFGALGAHRHLKGRELQKRAVIFN